MDKTSKRCNFCGSGSYSTTYSNLLSMYSNFQANIDSCSFCGHGVTNPAPDPETVKNIYSNTYSIPSQKLIRREKRRNSRLIIRWMLNFEMPTKVLEVGCMFGDLLAVFSEFGIPAKGVELDAFATHYAKGEGRDVICGNFENLLENKYLIEANTIVMVHCLEHFHDPEKVLSTLFVEYPQVENILIVVPNFGSSLRKLLGKYWGSFQIGTHFNHFSDRSLQALVSKSGWSVVTLKFAGADSIFFGATFINFLLRLGVRINLNKPQKIFALPMQILGLILTRVKKFGRQEIWCLVKRLN